MQELAESLKFAAVIIIILQFMQILQLGAIASYLRDKKK